MATWKWCPTAARCRHANPSAIANCMLNSPSPHRRSARGSGTWQQRRVLMGLLRNPGAGFVPEQNLRRRPSLGGVRAIPSTGECRHGHRDSGKPMTSFFTDRVLIKMASCCARRESLSCTMECWCRTTWSYPAPPATMCGLHTNQRRISCPSVCRTTAIRCASAISGFVNWPRVSRTHTVVLNSRSSAAMRSGHRGDRPGCRCGRHGQRRPRFPQARWALGGS